MEDLKMKTLCIAFTIRAVTSSKMANNSKERSDAHVLQFHTPTVINQNGVGTPSALGFFAVFV